MPTSKLTVMQIKSAKPKDREYKIWDGLGLFLLVKPSGSKLWRRKYRFEGKEKLRSFGPFPIVSLEQVRKLLEQDLSLIKQGIDPVRKAKEERLEVKIAAENSFKTVSEEWAQLRMHTWKSEKHKNDVMRSLNIDIIPELGSLPVSVIKPSDVLKTVKLLENRGLGETVYRTLQRISSIFKYAIATGRCETNPARDLPPALKKIKVIHHPALPVKELGEFLRQLENYEGYIYTKISLELIHLTALRSRELRLGRWSEINLDSNNPIWRVPASRMKNVSDHLVPLSIQSVRILHDLRTQSVNNDLLFPGRNNPAKPISENTMNRALWNMGYKGKHSSHGARSCFSTICNESGFWSPDSVERQLSHTPRNKIRAAYHRGEHLEERKKLMQWWADHLDDLKGSTD